MNPRRRKLNKLLVDQYLRPSIPYAILFFPTFFVGIIYFEFDPLPHFFRAVGVNPATALVFILRIIVEFFSCYEPIRFTIEYNILTVFLFQHYEYVLTFLSKLVSPKQFLYFYDTLTVCHSAISPYTNSMYFVTFVNCMVNSVILLWLTVRAFHIAPIVLYIWFPVMAIVYSGMVVVMTNILGATVYNKSNELLSSWKKGYRYVPTSRIVRKELQSKSCLAFCCGPQIKIRKSTALTYLHIVLNNWGTAVLVIRI